MATKPAKMVAPPPILNPLSVQIGGQHYKSMTIQPLEYSMANQLDACQHTIVKYVTRFREKGGVQDLEKAKHVLDILIEMETNGATAALRARLDELTES